MHEYILDNTYLKKVYQTIWYNINISEIDVKLYKVLNYKSNLIYT